MLNRTFVDLIICLLILLSACSIDKKDTYVFSYFTNNGHDGLHLAYSYDGHKWEVLNNGQSFIQPVIGKDSLMRDPSIAQGKDQVFHMVWTTGWWDQGIGYASSKDLINWSEQQYLPVMEHLKETRNTWAPEIYFDDSSDLFYIIWASTVPLLFPEIETTKNENGLNHKLYYTTTTDFKTYAPTSLFFDPGFSVIDGAIIKSDSTYMLVMKNEMSVPKEKNLRVSFTTDLSKGFPSQVSNNISGNSWVEGPTPIKIGNYTYIYFDKYKEKKYGAIRSLDGQNWEDISESIDLPIGIRHGTAFKVSKNILNNLLDNTPNK